MGERDLSVGVVASIQTHGSLANWHPHLHLLVTDGGFRPDGTFVRWALHDVATLTEAFRRAVLRRFVRRELMEEETALGMLAGPMRDSTCTMACGCRRTTGCLPSGWPATARGTPWRSAG